MARCQVTLLNGIVSLNNKAMNLKYLSFPFSKHFPTWKTSLKCSLINLTVKREIRQIKNTHNSGIEQSGEKKWGVGGMADSSYKAGELPFSYIINSREMPRGWQATQLRRKR